MVLIALYGQLINKIPVGKIISSDISHAPGAETARGRETLGDMSTYHFKVLGAALVSAIVAGEQHVLDVVARSIVELAHVEGSRFKGQEVSFDLQGLQNALLYQVSVPNLISADRKINK